LTLDAGTKLGPYEIAAPLGAGGMGEVYRARDTRLDREVAIKVLPKHLTSNAELKQRLEREARSISALTHPNICTLHDVGHEDGVDYLVMEYLEGETLAERIAKGPIPLEELYRIGTAIASALEKAHRAGVVHRDLKPGNIMLTKVGAKLLDFGLAKSVAGLTSSPDAATLTEPLTSKGTLVGTFQYMAPEQLEGSEADARTDVFAFGAVLYEMATGRRAFEGSSRASLIASIMASHPRTISELQPMTPPALEHLVRACLAKDPDDRIQTAHDVKLQLQWIAEAGSQVGTPAPLVGRRKQRERVWALGCLVLFAACVVLAVLASRPAPAAAPRVWATIPNPDGAMFYPSGDAGGPVVISPDGTMLAFVASGTDGARLWIRPLRDSTARPLQGTKGATFPFWSADSRSLGYFANEKLFTINTVGGPPVPICDASAGRGGTWNREGVILFAPAFRSAIFRVAATGGQPQPVTTVDESKHTSHRWPQFCPDGRHFLYIAVAHGAADSKDNALFLASLDDSEPKFVLHGGVNGAVADGRLLYVRQNMLLAEPFDVTSARRLGDPSVVATGVLYDVSTWRAGFSVSRNGILAFNSGRSQGEIHLTKFDRSGKKLSDIGEPGNFSSLSLSPDGTRIATEITGAATDVWIYEVARGVRTRLTFEDGSDLAPIWSPDGKEVAYAHIHLAQLESPRHICRRPAIGGDEEVLYESSEDCWPTDWSRDGKYILMSCGKYIGGDPCDIWVLPLFGDRKAYPLVKTPSKEDEARFSPDGRWIAYSSDESGRNEIYLIPFTPDAGDHATAKPPRGGKWQVSSHGGSFPRWSKDGKELIYMSGELGRGLTAVDIEFSPDGAKIGAPTPLFDIDQVAGTTPYDTAPDGDWFVVNMSAVQSTASVNLITNWTAELTGG